MRTRHLQSVTHEHLVTTTTRSSVLSPFGPVRVGLTTSQTTQEARLTELLNSLESAVANLNYKSSTVLDTLTTVTQRIEAALLSNTQTNEVGTDDRDV